MNDRRELDTPDAVLDFPLTGVGLIEASAGTGKTYTIANLYLRHIVEGRSVAEVLVVTFTVAATDELRGRIRARLFQALDLMEHGPDGNKPDPFLTALLERLRQRGHEEQQAVARRLRLAVRAMDEAAIYTIHGFCQRALTEFAFNSGQQFQLEILTDDQDLWRQAVQDWWRRAGYPLNPIHARLFRDALGDMETFHTLLDPLLGAESKRLLPRIDENLRGVMDHFGPVAADLEGLAGEWRNRRDILMPLLLESKGLSRAQTSPYHPSALRPTLARLDAWFESGPADPPPEHFQALTIQCLRDHALKKPDPHLEDLFFEHCGRIVETVADLHRNLRVVALAEAAAFARQQVARTKQLAQQLSFNDLLTELHRALHGERGDALADGLRARFPVAMIDEFQDTDPVQYGIFARLYPSRRNLCLVMIGDPKQAIYSFRGGDIFTYMRAKRDAGPAGCYTLGTNWRSTPEVIGAVNTLFGRRETDAFVYGDTIPFEPVRSADRNHRPLVRCDAPQTALTLWTLPVTTNSKGEAKALSKEKLQGLCHQAVAHEIRDLIQQGRDGISRLGDEPLRPRDIAVLVRSGFEAAGLRQELGLWGINAVSVERSTVFHTDEALALEQLLQAVLEPGDRDKARLALTASLLNRDLAAIERVIQDDAEWTDWVDGLLTLRETWQRRGFMAMFQQMLHRMGLAQALTQAQQAERRLTNLLHLGELIQQASKTHPGLDALLRWYRHQRQSSTSDETQLRLESDEELVQIVTVHSSKGLEYSVVFVPYLWSCKPRGTDGLLAFHDTNGMACLDAGSDATEDHLHLAEKERLAEDVRLAYVALTRAESALYLVWGRAGTKPGHAGQTALGWLLHPHQSPGQLNEGPPDAFADMQQLDPDLDRLAGSAKGTVRIAPLPEVGEPQPLLSGDDPEPVQLGKLERGIPRDWRISSFSELARNVHAEGIARPLQLPNDPALLFPAGSHVGSYLHLLLEHLDFQGRIEDQVLEHSARIAPRFGIDHARWGADAARWLERVVRTPLDDSGLTLADLPFSARFNELEFDFATGTVDLGLLERIMEQAADRPLPPLDAEAFQGMVNGIVDLVFKHEGRFYIADYKSNFLGGDPGDYAPEPLRRAVYAHRYDLQYLLYTLALHRYLRARIKDYDYETYVGGAYYLFLRGMHPETRAGHGVHFDRPDRALVEALDERIFPYHIRNTPPEEINPR